MKDKVLVTGANGLLGTNTILVLLKKGYLVNALVRQNRTKSGFQHINLKYFIGDITDAKSLNAAILDCKFVIHVAALTDPSTSSYKEFEIVNVQGTKNVIDAALKNRIQRIIYVSTANVFGFGSMRNLGDELQPMKFPFSGMHYPLSKLKAEEYVLSKSKEIDVIIVNPTFMIGAYDKKPSSGRIILTCLNNRLVLCPPGGKNFVCVKDVAQGIINALLYGKNKESYLLSNENLSYFEFFKRVRRITKKSFVILRIPSWIIKILGIIGDILRFAGFRTALTSINVKVLSVSNFYSNQKAREDLNMNFHSINIGIYDAVRWFENRFDVDLY